MQAGPRRGCCRPWGRRAASDRINSPPIFDPAQPEGSEGPFGAVDGSRCGQIPPEGSAGPFGAVDGSRPGRIPPGGGRGRSRRTAPEASIPWCNMALVLYEMNRSAEAEYYLSVAEELGGDDPALWNNVGVIMAGMGRHQEASESFSKAIRADWYYAPPPGTTGAYPWRGSERSRRL